MEEIEKQLKWFSIIQGIVTIAAAIFIATALFIANYEVDAKNVGWLCVLWLCFLSFINFRYAWKITRRKE
ncbi:hypothetical protein LCGC14_1985900 [marine sediment metagenome]|uniref:Uncharacterized protein n=1 Tax=marine sediment metagenome TaxID=412755 RepID=A0A0F9I4M7_9ZZZZ